MFYCTMYILKGLSRENNDRETELKRVRATLADREVECDRLRAVAEAASAITVSRDQQRDFELKHLNEKLARGEDERVNLEAQVRGC